MSTRRPASRDGASALAVSAWPLSRKVALALAIPLLLAGILGGLRVQSYLAEASNSSSSAHQVAALRPAVDYLNAAEQAMVAAASTGDGSQAALEDALVRIRRAGREMLESKESADLTDDQRHQMDAVLDLSQALRAKDAITLSAGTWEAQLRQLQSGVAQLIATIVNEQINPEPLLELLPQALSGRFSLAMQQTLVATERTGETGSLELFSELGVEGAAIDRLASAPGTSEKAVASLRTANAQRFRTVRTGGTDLGGANAYGDYDSIISALQDGIDAKLEAAAAKARTDAFVNLAITLAALVAAVLLAILISRLLLNPIRRVREGALAVAHERLPEAVARIRAGEEPGEITPIDVTTGEEIGQLARAVDDLHRQAVVLASGEANLRSQVSQMFVTLSRRNTSLINQQLGLIERLERDEEDPKRLESLFRLDHLAARMRRTADSLLILADAPTVAAVVDGLTVSDALQAATSGVQDYQRVRIGSANPMRINDSAAADVVHLLTELIDNALTYSPPTSTVIVGSTNITQGVVIEVADAGLGIPPEQLAKINEILGSGGEVTPETARRMGLFVVSRLSQRHGLTTSLRANDEGGTTATVTLPVAILPELAPPAVSTRREAVPRSDAPKAAETRAPDEAVRKAQKPDRKPETVKAKDEMSAGMDVKARIDAALGLPARTTGATVDPAVGVPTPVTTSTAFAALAALRSQGNGHDPAPTVSTEATPPPAVVQSVVRPVTEPVIAPVAEAPREPVAAVAAPAAVPETTAEPPADPAPAPLDVPADEPAVTAAPEPAEQPARPTIQPTSRLTDLPARRKDAAAPPAASAPEPAAERGSAPVPEPVDVREPAPAAQPTSASLVANAALDGDWTDPGDEGFDTPIFRSLRSAWLSTDGDGQPWRTSEIEAGWEVADHVAETSAEIEVSQSGLPVRRPGSRLVPGGVTTTSTATVRDPEAIKARLAAHASGVSRGRAAAATATAAPDPS